MKTNVYVAQLGEQRPAKAIGPGFESWLELASDLRQSACDQHQGNDQPHFDRVILFLHPQFLKSKLFLISQFWCS